MNLTTKMEKNKQRRKLFYQEINRTNKLLDRLTNKKRKGTNISVRNEWGSITTDLKHLERIIK